MKIFVAGAKNETEEFISHVKKDIYEIEQVDFSVDGKSNPLNKLADQFLIVFCNPKQYEAIESIVEKEHIIRWYKYCDTLFADPLDGITNDTYTGLLFGMSHSQAVVNETRLTGAHFYKVASPSMDMFCHYKFIQKVATMVDCDSIHTIILEIPYYIFNYDLSRFGSFVYTKLNYFDLIGDYHHFDSSEHKGEILEFQRLKTVLDLGTFSPKAVSRDHVSVFRNMYRDLKICVNAARNSDSVWSKIYNDTVKENQEYYKKFLECAESKFHYAKTIILVTPFNPAFRLTHHKQIEKQKEIFYSIVKEDQSIIDDFTLLKKSSFFADHCHIKKKYSDYYTKHINQMLTKYTSSEKKG